ncbi:hypothetical protein HPB47_021460 [Ixodes persulcatus]|uniref:Uncharacterized protein n=1 Tax=Ixodes persulcatus TaxID=34615 RepID=A0AC60QCK7_IXOPE|nr:hypothetical protein HPB47_021460 [Ixodes persulcatus]
MSALAGPVRPPPLTGPLPANTGPGPSRSGSIPDDTASRDAGHGAPDTERSTERSAEQSPVLHLLHPAGRGQSDQLTTDTSDVVMAACAGQDPVTARRRAAGPAGRSSSALLSS